jgi:SNF2 family DNA or RNA helicase
VLTFQAISVARRQRDKFNGESIFSTPPPDIQDVWLDLNDTEPVAYHSSDIDCGDYDVMTEQGTQEAIRHLWDPETAELWERNGIKNPWPSQERLVVYLKAMMSANHPGVHRVSRWDENGGKTEAMAQIQSLSELGDNSELAVAGNDDGWAGLDNTTRSAGRPKQRTSKEALAAWLEELRLYDRFNESTKVKWTLAYIDTVLADPSRGSILVFAKLTTILDTVQVGLEKKNIRWDRYDGRVTDKERSRIAEEWKALEDRKERRVMLISLGAGGEGLTLIAAKDVVIITPDWNPNTFFQAYSRAYRFGQDMEVRVRELWANRSMDVHIYRAASRKEAMGKDFHVPLECADPGKWEEVKSWDLDAVKQSVCASL